MIETEAWVLHQGDKATRRNPMPGELVREKFRFAEIADDEVLAQPIYGCWEGNMTHALNRDPVDICRFRRESKIILGNSGAVRILQTGKSVVNYKEGDYAVLVPIGLVDDAGYMTKAYGYDAPNTIGMLAKTVKIHHSCLHPIAKDSRFNLQQWAAYPIRFFTAWSNWKLAYACYRLQMDEERAPTPYVVGWGGGVAYGQLLLAQHFGCKTAMVSSRADRIAELNKLGIAAIDRREFPDLYFDEKKYLEDKAYKRIYLKNEKRFLEMIKVFTKAHGVSIFIDHIGDPVTRATVRALARQGVLTTAGWKHGMFSSLNRAASCTDRHIHVHTHGAKHSEVIAAIAFSENTGWGPPVEKEIYAWDDIPLLAERFAKGEISSYFPCFQINPE